MNAQTGTFGPETFRLFVDFKDKDVQEGALSLRFENVSGFVRFDLRTLRIERVDPETPISIFDEYGWDWTYHAFREASCWSLEHEGTSWSDVRPSADNPRKRVVLDWLRR